MEKLISQGVVLPTMEELKKITEILTVRTDELREFVNKYMLPVRYNIGGVEQRTNASILRDIMYHLDVRGREMSSLLPTELQKEVIKFIQSKNKSYGSTPVTAPAKDRGILIHDQKLKTLQALNVESSSRMTSSPNSERDSRSFICKDKQLDENVEPFWNPDRALREFRIHVLAMFSEAEKQAMLDRASFTYVDATEEFARLLEGFIVDNCPRLSGRATRTQTPVYCALCSASTTSFVQYREHITSPAHKKKLTVAVERNLAKIGIRMIRPEEVQEIRSQQGLEGQRQQLETMEEEREMRSIYYGLSQDTLSQSDIEYLCETPNGRAHNPTMDLNLMKAFALSIIHEKPPDLTPQNPVTGDQTWVCNLCNVKANTSAAFWDHVESVLHHRCAMRLVETSIRTFLDRGNLLEGQVRPADSGR